MIGLPHTNRLFGFIPIYGFLIVIGMVLAIFFSTKEEKRLGLPQDTIIDAALIAIPSGIIGARLYYVLFTWENYRNQLNRIFAIWDGGLDLFG